jgi:hypothetical protein
MSDTSRSKVKRKLSPEISDPNKSSTAETKRRKSRSVTNEVVGRINDLLKRTRTLPSIDKLDRMNYYIQLQYFASGLQSVANAIFPGDQISRYAEVDVILLSWEDEDPRLLQSVQSVSDCSVSSSVGLFCFSQSVEDYFRVSQSVRIKGISY